MTIYKIVYPEANLFDLASHVTLLIRADKHHSWLANRLYVFRVIVFEPRIQQCKPSHWMGESINSRWRNTCGSCLSLASSQIWEVQLTLLCLKQLLARLPLQRSRQITVFVTDIALVDRWNVPGAPSLLIPNYNTGRMSVDEWSCVVLQGSQNSVLSH
jgi:hypothetical protein